MRSWSLASAYTGSASFKSKSFSSGGFRPKTCFETKALGTLPHQGMAGQQGPAKQYVTYMRLYTVHHLRLRRTGSNNLSAKHNKIYLSLGNNLSTKPNRIYSSLYNCSMSKGFTTIVSALNILFHYKCLYFYTNTPIVSRVFLHSQTAINKIRDLQHHTIKPWLRSQFKYLHVSYVNNDSSRQ